MRNVPFYGETTSRATFTPKFPVRSTKVEWEELVGTAENLRFQGITTSTVSINCIQYFLNKQALF